MKKLLLAVGAIVLSSNVNAMGGMGCEGHTAPFLGINTHKDKCCIIFNDADGEKVILSGPAKTTYAINKNHVIAKCQIDIPEEIANEIAAPVNGRNQVEFCHIGVKHKGKATGSGGFTIDLEERIINGNCKADNNYEF